MSHILKVIALAAVAAFPVVLGAQRTRLQVTLGGGLGHGSTSCTDCFATSEAGRAGFVQLDLPLDGTSRVGLQWDRWRGGDYEGGRSDFLMLMTEHRPLTERVFLKAGAGYGSTHYNLRRLVDTPLLVERAGFAYQFGIGYEVPLRGRIAMAPYAQIGGLRNGAGRVNGAPSETATFSTTQLQYGIAVRAR